MLISDAAALEFCVRESLAGNREAFGRIVEQFQGIVSSVTLSLTGDFQRSEDLAQETFLRAWTKLSELKEPQKIGHWLCAIARNLAKNEISAQKRMIQGSDLLEFHPDSGKSQEMDFQNESLLAALAAIPEKYRQSLILFYREELSITEIATLLEKPEGTIKQRLYRGRKLLRHEMERLMEVMLRTTRPGKTFTLAVLATIPMIAAGSTGTVVAQTVMGTTPLLATAVSTESAKGGFFATFAKNMLWLLSICFWPMLTIGFFLYPLYDTWRTSHDVPSLELRRRMIRGHAIFYSWLIILSVATCLFDAFGLRKVFPTLFGGNPVAQLILLLGFLYFIWKALPERLFARKLLKNELNKTGKVTPVQSLERTRKFTKAITILCSICLFVLVPIGLVIDIVSQGLAVHHILNLAGIFVSIGILQIAFCRALRKGFATTKDEAAFEQSIEKSGGIEKITRRYKRLMLTNTIFYGLLAIALGGISLCFLRELIANLFFNYSFYKNW